MELEWMPVWYSRYLGSVAGQARDCAGDQPKWQLTTYLCSRQSEGLGKCTGQYPKPITHEERLVVERGETQTLSVCDLRQVLTAVAGA